MKFKGMMDLVRQFFKDGPEEMSCFIIHKIEGFDLNF